MRNRVLWSILALICVSVSVYAEDPDKTVTVGESINLSASATDSDCDMTTNPPRKKTDDNITYTWSAVWKYPPYGQAGSFNPGGNTGTGKTVTWVSPSLCTSSTGDVTITVMASNSQSSMYPDDSASDQVWVKVILGDLEERELSPGFSCYGACSGNAIKQIDDSCGNTISIICAQPDGTGGLTDCAYRYRWNGLIISSCIWAGGNNAFLYDEFASSNGNLFHGVMHVKQKPSKFFEGCIGYFCTKIVAQNFSDNTNGLFWRRHDSIPPFWPDDGEPCPGH